MSNIAVSSKCSEQVADGWVVEQINFVAGNRGSVMESDFYEKLEKLDVQAEKKTKFSQII